MRKLKSTDTGVWGDATNGHGAGVYLHVSNEAEGGLVTGIWITYQGSDRNAHPLLLLPGDNGKFNAFRMKGRGHLIPDPDSVELSDAILQITIEADDRTGVIKFSWDESFGGTVMAPSPPSPNPQGTLNLTRAVPSAFGPGQPKVEQIGTPLIR